ncbi:MAG: phage tail sheath protein [Salinisphaeraceae bacterium]
MYQHGVRVIEINEGTRPIRTISTAVIGMVCTGSDADDAYFPLNTPVVVTDLYEAIGKAGTSQNGTLKPSLDAILDQARPVVVVVRVEEGVDAAETDANVIGTVDGSGNKTGLQALIASQGQNSVKPRILGCPGLDTQAVATELASVAEALNGFGYIHANGAVTHTEAITYADNFSQRELMLIWPDFRGYDVDQEATVTAPAVARALGLRAKLDQTVGWHKTLSNAGVNGVTGLSQDVSWDLQSTSTEAALLNEANVTTLVNANGFRFWGSRTLSDEPLFSFENYTRTAQVIADSLAEAHLWAIDKPMHPSLVNDIIEGLNAKGREWTRLGYLLGFNAYYSEEVNTQTTIKDGKLYIDYDYTPVPPLENLNLQQRITDRFLVDFAARVDAA